MLGDAQAWGAAGAYTGCWKTDDNGTGVPGQTGGRHTESYQDAVAMGRELIGPTGDDAEQPEQ